jgi:hypothetical protein
VNAISTEEVVELLSDEVLNLMEAQQLSLSINAWEKCDEARTQRARLSPPSVLSGDMRATTKARRRLAACAGESANSKSTGALFSPSPPQPYLFA